MADADVDDICRVLAVCFRHGNSLSELDIERVLSFDMGWLSPDEASTAVHALMDSGWLIGDEDSLQPVIKNISITTPLGWFPRPSRLINPVRYDSIQYSDKSEEEKIPISNQTKKIEEKVKSEKAPEIVSKDPRAKIERRLKRFVSKQSKIDIEEIERRIQRKKSALSFVTVWMCIALVAREQGLEMKDIIDALSGN
ncbi:MAG: hypothetical protein CMA45_03310 [Euryarchaeota archaeon]|nr:hypothetical protein [Euryarchaeota archaeon]